MKKSMSLLLAVFFTLVFLAGCAPQAANPEAPPQPAVSTPAAPAPAPFTYADTIAWDGEFDVIVVGYGGAGATASITAADEGANVLLLEKAPAEWAGGNSRVCAQVIMNVSDYDKGVAYFKSLRGEFTLHSDEQIAFMVKNIMETDEWLISMGAENVFRFNSAEYPERPGADAIDYTLVNGKGPTDMMNAAAWKLLSGNVEKRGDKIEVWYESPGKHLIQDPINKTILGVQVEREGKMLNIRALNGVVLACGGFENNPEMIQNYLARPYVFPFGTWYNTGDGITMALEAGAQLWHMGFISGPFMSYHPFTDNDTVWNLSMGLNHTKGKSMLNVGPDAKRFYNETGGTRHGHVSYNGVFKQQLAVTPAYTIFDETTRLAGPIHPTYQADNSDAIEKGIILKADTLAELAKKLGLDPAALENTVKEYNKLCADKKDIYFGRNPETMEPIKTAPYYAFSLVPGMVNTQGGPKRNFECEVLNTTGEPIPHLYSAGELGSFYDENYQGGGNMSECIWSGQIAGRNAAASKEALSDINLKTVSSNIIYSIDQRAETKTTEVALGQNEYLGEASGMGGKLVVKVKVEDGVIRSVEIVSHGESEGISDNAIERIPGMIVQANSAKVDTMSGCTITSNAIMAAVEDALSKVK